MITGRYVSFIVILVIVLGFAGCTETGTVNIANSLGSGGNIYSYNNYNESYNYSFINNLDNGLVIYPSRTHIIGIAMADMSSPYNQSLVNYATDEARKLGVDLLISDANWDAEKQVEQVSSFIKQRVDAIMLMPVDSEYLAASAKRVKEENIPLINLNTKLDDIVSDLVDAYVGVNADEQAGLAAELIIEALGEKGGNIIVFEGMQNTNLNNERTKGFVSRISQVKAIKIVDLISASWNRKKAYETTLDLLGQYPQINGIYAYDDIVLIGSIEAAKALNRQHEIKFVGVGGSIDGYEAIKEGELYGTVAQSPDWEGIQAVRCAVDILNYRKVKVWYRDPLFKVTKENVEKFKGLW